MIAVNMNTHDRIIYAPQKTIRHIGLAQGSAPKVYVKFCDEQNGSKAIISSYLGRKSSWVPIEQCETETSIKKDSTSPFRKKKRKKERKKKHHQAYLISVNNSMGIYCSISFKVYV